MKGVDIFCASQASTAIRLSHTMEIENDPYASSSSSSATATAASILSGGGSSGRAIDRHNPIIRDPRRLGKSIPYSSCSSQSQGEVINPIPLPQSHQNSQKNIVKKNSSPEPKKENPDDDVYVITTDLNKNRKKKKKKVVSAEPPKQGYEEKGKIIGPEIGGYDYPVYPNKNHGAVRKTWSCTSVATPVGSSRYLLSTDQNQTGFLNLISDFDPVLSLEPEESSKPHPSSSAAAYGGAAPPKPKPSAAWDVKSPPSPDSPPNQLQVVVLRVSLHCRGCEKKMKKHISRMEGVSSFNIDFAAKKLTVVGNVTPLAVLASVSKVKNAQLLPPVGAAVAQPSSSSGIDKNYVNQFQLPINTTIVSS